MKLLIVEDNPVVRERLERQFSHDSVIDTAVSGAEAIERVSGDYVVILLDLGLPDMPGLRVCQEIRGRGVEVPILVLTGASDVTSRVALLNAGADDYLIKPFNGDELRARVRALARRSGRVINRQTIELADLLIDHDGRKVKRAHTPISLTRKEFDILEYLTENHGRVLTRGMIFDHVWGADASSNNGTVDVHIKRLRDKVDRPFAVPLIHTAHGLGYVVDTSGR
jgi:DNA-binding response OmpR family regulator